MGVEGSGQGWFEGFIGLEAFSCVVVFFAGLAYEALTVQTVRQTSFLLEVDLKVRGTKKPSNHQDKGPGFCKDLPREPNAP